MKKFAFVLIIALAACGKGGAAGELGKLRDEACACKDKACADAVDKKLEKEIEKVTGSKEPDEATQKAMAEAMLEAGMCLSKLQ